jgi:hypothetical protein
MGSLVDFAEMKAHCSVDREGVDQILGWELTRGSENNEISIGPRL